MATAGITAGEFYYMLRSDAKLPNEMLGIIAAMLYPVSVFFLGSERSAVREPGAAFGADRVVRVLDAGARARRGRELLRRRVHAACCCRGIVVVRSALPAPWGGVLVLGIFLSVWANDSFAYLVGSKFGKHKLAPRTSPKKSWEGFLAGLVGSAAVLVPHDARPRRDA